MRNFNASKPKAHVVVMYKPNRLHPETLEADSIEEVKRIVKENVANPRFVKIAHYTLTTVYKHVK